MKKFSFFFILYLSMIIITMCDCHCNLKEITKKNGLRIEVQSPSNYCMYFNLNTMPINTEGILTFHISNGLLMDEHIKHFHSSIVYDIDESNLELHFPRTEDDNVFPYETAFEYQYEHSFSTIRHLYFTKNKNSKDCYLLIFMETDIYSSDPHSYYEFKVLSPFYLSTDAGEIALTVPSPNFSMNFDVRSREPYYINYNFPTHADSPNILLSSKDDLFTYTCNSLLISDGNSYTINTHRYYGYMTDITSLNSNGQICKKMIIKCIINSSYVRYVLNIQYLTHPFLPIRYFNQYQKSFSFPYEISNSDETHNFIGIFNDNMHYLYLQYDIIYGQPILYYKSDAFYAKDVEPEDIDRTYEQISHNSIIDLDNLNPDIFHLKCDNYCLVKFTFIRTLIDQRSIAIIYSGLYYMTLKSKEKSQIGFSTLSQFQVQIESLSNSNVKGSFENENFHLTPEDNSYRTVIDLTGEFDDEDVYCDLLSEKTTLIKIKVKSDEEEENIKLGSSKEYTIGTYEYNTKIFYFEFPQNAQYKYYQIDLSIKDEDETVNKPVSFFTHYGYMKGEFISVPTFFNSFLNYIHPINNERYSIELPNPYLYSKLNDKIDNDTKIYYAIKFYETNKKSIASFSYSGIIIPHYQYLSKENMIAINLKKDDDNSYLLKKNKSPKGKSLLINFYQCYNIDLNFELKQINNQTLNKGVITEKRTRYKISDIGSDYIIKFTGEDNRIMMNYFYVSDVDLGMFDEYEENNILTFTSIKQNKNTNSDIKITFKPYLRNRKNIKYEIYLTPFNDGYKDRCDFLTHSPKASFYHNDTDGRDIEAEVYDIKPGSYWVYVVGKEQEEFKSFKVYNRLKVHLGSGFFVMKFILTVMGVVLMIALIPMFQMLCEMKKYVWKIKKQKRNEFFTENNAYMLR